MAHPFAAVPLGFSVMGPKTLWWGGCAWDSFALPHLVPDAPEERRGPHLQPQRLFCRRACVTTWLARTGHDEGCVMDLATLWRLASHWYDGRLERGYTRREPAAAVDYFRSVGLTGPFWEP